MENKLLGSGGVNILPLRPSPDCHLNIISLIQVQHFFVKIIFRQRRIYRGFLALFLPDWVVQEFAVIFFFFCIGIFC